MILYIFCDILFLKLLLVPVLMNCNTVSELQVGELKCKTVLILIIGTSDLVRFTPKINLCHESESSKSINRSMVYIAALDAGLNKHSKR